MHIFLLVIAVASTKLLLSLVQNPIVWVTAITTVVIPFLTAAVTRPSTAKVAKTAISFILAGIYALVAWLGALNGNVDWKAALVVFVTAAAGAGGINSAWVSGHISTWLGLKVPINIGAKPLTPEKAAEIHSSESGLTVPVPSSVTTLPPSWQNLPQMDSDVVAAEQDPELLAAIKSQLEI
jgi:hypothetical protein